MVNYSKIKASTQEHLDIEDITDDLVIMKTGWVTLVMTTTAINFDILSEAEQDATIYAYGALLNSLSFPLEILIRSKKADITSYFQSLTEAERKQTNPDLKRQIQKYQDFIQSTVQQKTVLDKKFYLIIKFSPLELGFKGVKGAKPTKAKSKASLISDAKIALLPKRDHLIKQMSRLGLNARQLTTQELIELFYDIYNPAPLGTQRVILDSQSYTTPLVEPAVEVPVPAPSRPEAFQTGGTSGQETIPRTGGSQEPEVQLASPSGPEAVRAGGQIPPAPQSAPMSSNQIPDTNLRPVPPQSAPPVTTQTSLNQQPITATMPASGFAVQDTGGQSPGNVPQAQFQMTQGQTPPPTFTGQSPHQPVTGQVPQSGQATSQTEALQKLQEATARAAGFVNSTRQVNQQTSLASPGGQEGEERF
ncbi:hypothetical protein A3E14_01255 [Candidatus Curtissbacteria bacterium RIFCSPHIGHO2_12_FULL_41_13]|nr:MAG: hypothetical protein A3E14_01255 [Candidatus Curtissbacteria bacterium RIFCSPHIGHO2_12_FULL_41_13]